MAEFVLPKFGDRLNNAFGFQPETGTPKATEALGASFQVEVFEQQQAVYKSRMGTAVFDVVELYDTKGNLVYSFDLPPFLDCNISKNINTTVVNNDGAEVVESYGNQSWVVRMRGVLVDMDEHNMPLSQMELMRQTFDVNNLFEVTSDYLNALGITHLYFTDFEPAPVEGFKDTISFTISAKSIKPADFVLFTPK